jgi:hypothetical protein
MTIDERLERLTERHEALAQALEIIAGMQLAAEKRAAQAAVLQSERDAKYNERFDRVLGLVENLTALAQSHENRISGLEGR